MTYDERVQAIAQEMAEEKYPSTFGQHFDNSVDSTFNGQEQDYCINECIPYARIAVKHIAEAATNALITDFSGSLDSGGAIHMYLLEHGLISDSEPEVILAQFGYDSNNPEPENWQL